MEKVRSFLLMIVTRRRFYKKLDAVFLLQRYLKSYISWKDTRKEYTEARDLKRILKL